jgi:branched-chain amino acid transport system ATP-binding protein
MLELKDVHTYYGDSHVLHGVNASVRAGEVVALLGRNGVGKTTTIRTIMGLTPARSGTVTFEGEDITHLPTYKIARRGIGIVPQGRGILPSLTVKESLTLGARKGQGDDAWTLDRVYELFPILHKRAKVKGTQLSGGEQQMLAIARALLMNPRLLLMDEPSEGLAPIVIEEIAGVITEHLSTSSLAVLLVEQNLKLALDVADRVLVMSKGKIVHENSVAGFASDTEAQSRHLGAAGAVAAEVAQTETTGNGSASPEDRVTSRDG